MVVTIINTFFSIGESTDVKPRAPKGAIFIEIDSRKLFIFKDGTWQQIIGGAGTWSPTNEEILANKHIKLEDNFITTEIGLNGIFTFVNGEFSFLDIGSAGLFLKVNATGDGFIFADPATSGSWNPTSSEEIQNKIIKLNLNTLRQETPAAGSILVDNGTKFMPIPKGANGTFLGVDESGNVGFYTVEGGGGGGSSTTNVLNLPSKAGEISGYWHGGKFNNANFGFGELTDNIAITQSLGTLSYQRDSLLGKFQRLTFTSASSFGGIKSVDKSWRRNWSSYFKFKWKINSTSDYDMFLGFSSDLVKGYSENDSLDDTDSFCFGRSGDNNYAIIRNANGTNQVKTVLNGSGGTPNYPVNAGVNTIELISDHANNRFGYKFNNDATWRYFTDNIPRLNIDLGIIARVDCDISSGFNYDMFLLESTNKLLV
jgi:hypothetical protein